MPSSPEGGSFLRRRAGLLAALLFLTLAPLAAHVAFSSLGHNPTDDGFILAYSRRVLDGEVPHRDFISIRPAGSAYLHAPVVAFGGDATFLLSRFVVLVQAAAIAWSWASLAGRALEPHIGPLRTAGLALLAFAFTLHSFPLMAWHTLDGLFALSVGLALLVDGGPRRRLAGYALVGAACLFKQNFALAIPAVLVLTGDWRRPARVAASLAPGLAYALFLLLAGALPDGLAQMRSLAGELPAVGLHSYVIQAAFPWGLLVGLGGTLLAAGRTVPPGLRIADRWQAPAAALFVLFLTGAIAAAIPTARFVPVVAFALFGLALGAAGAAFVLGLRRLALLGALAGLAAWTASLSFGYNSPALGAGALASALLAILCALPPARGRRGPRLRDAAFALLLVVTLASLVSARLTHAYLEPPASEMTRPLGDVLAGGEGIRTSEGTYAFLADLQTAIAQAGPGPYAILPDVPSHWVKSEQRNPLPIDWPLDLELNKPSLTERVTGSLDAQRGNLTVLVQKVRAQDLATGLVPLEEGQNRVVDHVRQEWEKVGETRLFDLYR